MNFTAKDVAELRLKTAAGMMECKNALKKADGNLEKAGEILRQKGLIAAAKKAEKTALEGIVASKILPDKKTGVLIELNTQTDFVAKNESFLELSKTILDALLTHRPKNIDELLKLKVNSTPISEIISSKITMTGENIQVRRFYICELNNNHGIISSYIHPIGNKIGVLIKLTTSLSTSSYESDLEELAKNIAMHIAACQPQAEYVDKTQVPKDVIENERRIELGKEDVAKKPKEIAEKIVQGRVDKILSQRCLMQQPYIKDQSITIEKLVKDKSKKLNIEMDIRINFVRYNVGETVEHLTSDSQKSTVSIS